jgi:hypothetical protein
VGPKILAYHIGKAGKVLAFPRTFNHQARLAPRKARRTARHRWCTRFAPDGKAVLYTSDLTAYSNMYLVEVASLTSCRIWSEQKQNGPL